MVGGHFLTKCPPTFFVNKQSPVSFVGEALCGLPEAEYMATHGKRGGIPHLRRVAFHPMSPKKRKIASLFMPNLRS